MKNWSKILIGPDSPIIDVIKILDRTAAQIVLVVDHRIPEPDRDAGSRAIFGCLEALLSAGLVVKFWPHDLIYNPVYTEVLQDMGIEVFHGPGHASFESWISIHGADIDHVMISRPAVAEDVLPMVRRHSRAKVIYYGHDLHFRRLRQQGELRADARLLRQAGRMEAKERHLWRAADVALYLSEEEAAIARALEPAADMRAVVPYGFTRFAPNRQPPPEFEVIFVAGFGHPPNEEAACWMVAEVWPLVAIRVPEATLTLVGSNPTARVRRLARADVIVTGPVSEEALYRRYAAARVAVVPLRSGAGVKLKTVEAMVKARPWSRPPSAPRACQVWIAWRPWNPSAKPSPARSASCCWMMRCGKRDPPPVWPMRRPGSSRAMCANHSSAPPASRRRMGSRPWPEGRHLRGAALHPARSRGWMRTIATNRETP